MSIYLHVYIEASKDKSQQDVDAKLNLAIDWIRYTNNCYLIYTTSSIDKWSIRLKPFVEPDGSLFICQVDLKDKNGWMTQDFWDWIEKRQNKTKEL